MKTETVKAISSLITVNFDRSSGYEQAAQTTTDPELKVLFTYLSKQSKEFTAELAECVKKQDPLVANEVIRTGVVKVSSRHDALFAHDRSTVLSSCEFKEDAAKRTYDDVMEHTEAISEEIYEIMCKQRSELHRTHSTVRSLYFSF